jgi:hypothetical protein
VVVGLLVVMGEAEAVRLVVTVDEGEDEEDADLESEGDALLVLELETVAVGAADRVELLDESELRDAEDVLEEEGEVVAFAVNVSV